MALLHTAVAKRISLGKAWREISPTGWLCCESSHMIFLRGRFSRAEKYAQEKEKNCLGLRYPLRKMEIEDAEGGCADGKRAAVL